MTTAERMEEAERRCASEPIHRLGRIQSHGVLVACDPATSEIRFCSANSAALVGLESDALLGHPLSVLGEDLAALATQAAGASAWSDGTPERVKGRIAVGPEGRCCEVAAHCWDGLLLVEMQTTSADLEDRDPIPWVDRLSQRLAMVQDVSELCALACEEIQGITGYQRVLAYRFDADWNGLVIAECPREGESARYLGLQFPASDIPPQARALYHQVPLRVIADAHDEGTPLLAADGEPGHPDLSHVLLRSVSPMHLAYLRNMGVRATIAVSLLVEGRLWGLIVAHDDHPYAPPQHVVRAMRVTCRIIGQMVASRLLAVEHQRLQVDGHALLNVIERIATASGASDTPIDAWHGLHADLLAWFEADGALLLHGGGIAPCVDPGAPIASECVDALSRRSPDTIFETDSLRRSGFADFSDAVAGLLWIPLPVPGDALLFWRKESTREVDWGGDPQKAMAIGEDGNTLGPRRSFAKWKEVRRDHSLPWTPARIEGARRVAAQWQLLLMEQARRNAEATIRRLEAGILRVNDGIAVARVDGAGSLVVEFANPLFEAMLHGGSPARGVAPAFLDPAVVEDGACAAIRAALASGQPTQFECVARDGRWLELDFTPVDDGQRAVRLWAAIVRDVTRRHQDDALKGEQARALRESNERYARILETSHEGILTLSGGGQVDYCNQRMLDILGLSEMPLGVPFKDVVADPADAAELLGLRTPSDAVRRREVALRRGPMGGVMCDVALIPLRQDGKQRSGWLLMATDISERQALENSLMLLNTSLEATIAERTAELVSAKEAADEASRSKSEFLANMSHELRSPLHGILGFTRLMIDDAEIPAEKRETYLRKVERNASNLLALVNDLLDSAKMESKSFSIAVARCDLVEIARNVITEFHADASTNPVIKALFPPIAPCNGDTFRLSQALRNLVANAIRFSPSGSRIQVAVERSDGGWCMAVRDRGPGIPPGELESIFERFAQSSATKTGAGGTGLGLHIARGIIQSHGGTLKAFNREGGGASFEAFIPDPR